VKDLHAAEWEELARREAYFPVLTHNGAVEARSNNVATDAFFETGEADVAALIAAIASLLGREPALTSALDFGCGAGRLTIPLARRSTTTVACDIAPTMLAHAAANVQQAGLRNVTFVGLDELANQPAGRFDFVCSLLVLQYIPPAAGSTIIRKLLNLLAPAGIAALHVVFAKPDPRSRFMRRVMTLRPHSEYTRTNVYDEEAVGREIAAAGARLIGRLPIRHDGAVGAVLIIGKPGV